MKPAMPAASATRRPQVSSRCTRKDETVLGNFWVNDQRNQARKASGAATLSARPGHAQAGGPPVAKACSGRLANGVARMKKKAPRSSARSSLRPDLRRNSPTAANASMTRQSIAGGSTVGSPVSRTASQVQANPAAAPRILRAVSARRRCVQGPFFKTSTAFDFSSRFIGAERALGLLLDSQGGLRQPVLADGTSRGGLAPDLFELAEEALPFLGPSLLRALPVFLLRVDPRIVALVEPFGRLLRDLGVAAALRKGEDGLHDESFFVRHRIPPG